MSTPRRLKKLFVPWGDLAATVSAVVADGAAHVQDATGATLFAAGELGTGDGPPIEITRDGTILALVTGPSAATVAPVVSLAIDGALDRRALADEVLQLYRRMRILVELSEILAEPENPDDVAERLVAETARALGDSAVSLHTPEDAVVCHSGAIDRLALPDVVLDDTAIVEADGQWQMLGPLPPESGFGCLRTARSTEYTAADASLLSTIVAIATPALLRAASHRRQLDDADRRSLELASTVEQLRSELEMATTRILATVIFTDLVDSTATQARVGDAAWAQIIVAHNEHVRTSIERWGGSLVEFTGDGVFGWFDSPSRALACLIDLRSALELMGLQMRAGLHTGEVEHRSSGAISGLTVNIAARLLGVSGAGEILASAVTTTLVDQQPSDFGETRSFELKGVPGVWDAKPYLRP